VVATVLKLKYRILANNLRRSPWQLVGFCFGILAAGWLLLGVVAGVVALGLTQKVDVVGVVAVIAGSALLLGWVIGPLLVAGADATLDPRALEPFPLTRRQVMLALTGTGLTGIPGIATALASLAALALWFRWPTALLVAVPCVLVAVLTCVVASRLVATLSVGLGGRRRLREVVGTVLIGLLILTGPILTGILTLVDAAADVPGRFVQAAAILGWTPLGAAWSAPADAADGRWLTAVAKLAIAVATLVVLWIAWHRSLEAAVSSPPRQAARTVRSGALGLFGTMPTGGVGATWARSLTAWVRDPRYLRQLIFVPLFPVIFAFAGGVDGWLFQSSAVMAALILCVGGYADISYDGTAFASVLASGVRGRADRWGRALGAACVGVPAVVLIAVVTTALSGSWTRFTALLGAALGLLLVGYGVSAVSSALIAVPVAAPGDSPFKTVPGQTFLSGLMVFAVMGACAVLASPAIVLAVVSTTSSSELLGAIALVVGIVVGAAVVVAGVAIGGRAFERTGPDLLVRIKAFPTT
jgi:ABC-2 type transport system permease protein